MTIRHVLALALAIAAAAGAAQAQSGASGGANSSTFCDRLQARTASQQDLLLRFAAVVRDELNDSDMVLISRSGMDLSRFKIRYSHAAIGWRGADGAWSARQLYYACDESRPRIYDQGLPGFVMGIDDPALSYISVVRIPAEAADSLRKAALDPAHALQLLSTHYSANAYAWSTRYQNCNQWVMEMLAVAWGGLANGEDVRVRAQSWLKQSNYAPEPVDIGSRLLIMASWFMPMLHLDDHPPEDRSALRLRVSLPAAAENFIRAHVPGSERIELCLDGGQVVVHKGWTPIGAGCIAGEGDKIISFAGSPAPALPH